ncbi:MAG: polyphosphate polymerase domain-containing protein [Actinomycetaceae bacterium]|nr:polyphosphate polymerase domain-containing protein [Actinomycetaceae bacterium]
MSLPLEHMIPADLSPISLEQLNRSAALLTRVDRKYILYADELPEILEAMSVDVRILDINGRRSHSYSSTYFDTDDLLSFRGTAHPRRRRFKVRTRTYSDSGQAYLELKTRGKGGATVKERVAIPLGVAQSGRLSPAMRRWVDTHIDPLVYEGVADYLSPTLLGNYQRATLLISGGGRATIDAELEWHLLAAGLEASREHLSLPEMVIVETKSGASPSSFDELLWQSGHRPARISKYATAMAAMVNGLPSNRWHRILGRHFDSAHSA